MRVELRVDIDDHEYAATVECDRAVPYQQAVTAASAAVLSLLEAPTEVS